ncbi:MAG: metallophosphoesterase [Sphingobacteriia bacterium]|nr:MAG: metallophosphoesterase [Sphingobacteriia bacterium]
MRSTGAFWMIALILFLLDCYVFQAVKTVTQPLSERAKFYIHAAFWVVSVLTLLALLAFPFVPVLQASKIFRNYVFAILAGLFLAKLIASVLFLTDDIRRLALWAITKFSRNTGGQFLGDGQAISRSTFMSWLGLAFGGTLFGTLLYGFGNKYNYQLKKITLTFNSLPKAFDGLKLVHISDIHSGSFQNPNAVNKGVDLILAQNPDLILFTGDLVNDRATEMNEYKAIFRRLKAPMGVYSILGNHDYGDYVSWPTEAEKMANLDQLKKVHAEMGWYLLMNEHILFGKEEEQLALIGIENWGAKGRFPKYGKMDQAYAGTEKIPFKVLLSHDPSHWDAQVKTLYPTIDLMLSGHTHGMQFGIENPYFKWSPVQWMYKQWAGLYEDGSQKLYVNRGFGFIGYPGRVGVLPEITLITLNVKG